MESFYHFFRSSSGPWFLHTSGAHSFRFERKVLFNASKKIWKRRKFQFSYFTLLTLFKELLCQFWSDWIPLQMKIKCSLSGFLSFSSVFYPYSLHIDLHSNELKTTLATMPLPFLRPMCLLFFTLSWIRKRGQRLVNPKQNGS